MARPDYAISRDTILTTPEGAVEALEDMCDEEIEQVEAEQCPGARQRGGKSRHEAPVFFMTGEFGAQIAMWSVPFELKSYKKALKKRGAVVTSSGNVLASRL